MTRTERKISIPDMVRQMIDAGASFVFSPGGSLYVNNLASLPCHLRDDFFACDEKQLVAHLRQMAAVAETQV